MVNMTHICFLAQTVDVIPHRETTHGIPGACLAQQRVNIQPGAEVLVVNPGQCPLFAEWRFTTFMTSSASGCLVSQLLRDTKDTCEIPHRNEHFCYVLVGPPEDAVYCSIYCIYGTHYAWRTLCLRLTLVLRWCVCSQASHASVQAQHGWIKSVLQMWTLVLNRNGIWVTSSLVLCVCMFYDLFFCWAKGGYIRDHSYYSSLHKTLKALRHDYK